MTQSLHRGPDTSDPLTPAPGRSDRVIANIHHRLKRAGTGTAAHDLTDDDLAELHKILQGAIAANSDRCKPVAEMLDKFVRAVCLDLNRDPHQTALPGPPHQLPYRKYGTTSGQDDPIFQVWYDKLDTEDGEFSPSRRDSRIGHMIS
jgi:hypothetical protein